MPITLAFDIGLAHTGVAISYENQLAQSLTTIHATGLDSLQNQMLTLIAEYQPDTIVLGIPSKGDINERATSLKIYLESKLGIKVELVNEDRSSQLAQKIMISAKTSLKKRQLLDHQIAAASILQQYLDDLLE